MTSHLKVYLAGEIHSNWRDDVAAACADLDVSFSGPVTDHDASDDCGVSILGPEPDKFWHDRKGALLNGIRTRTLLGGADIVVVRFGEKYRQWNAAFDAGIAFALGKPLIVLQPVEFDHALKEVNAAAMAVARSETEVANILRYVVSGRLG